MKGPLFHLSKLADRKLNLGWDDTETMITQCKPGETRAMRAVLKLQAAAFTGMTALTGYGAIETTHLDVSITHHPVLANAIEVAGNIALRSPYAAAALLAGATAVEAVANLKLVGIDYTPPIEDGEPA